jgi:hypothetical protein
MDSCGQCRTLQACPEGRAMACETEVRGSFYEISLCLRCKLASQVEQVQSERRGSHENLVLGN